MNSYINLINKTIDYIEENIFERLNLSDISKQAYLSEYHFERLFKVIVGKSLKQYVLGRKLTMALDRLNNTNDPIINIAMDFGFEYPEVFSRAFKKQFGRLSWQIKRDKFSISIYAIINVDDIFLLILEGFYLS